MGWGSWGRKPSRDAAPRAPLGLDFNAGRVRAALGRPGRNKLFPLDDAHVDLDIALSMEKRTPVVGHGVWAVSRKMPHVVCSGYLPHVGTPQEWKNGRTTLTADAAIALAVEKLKATCGRHDGYALALPAYLRPIQVAKLTALCDKSGLAVRGTATTALALAAERATHFLHGTAEPTKRSIAPTLILIVDVDEHAMTASVLRLAEEEVRVIATASQPRLGLRAWRERLLDGLSDRCVRQCRRDPRDSADVEQALFDQIDPAIEKSRTGEQTTLGVRSLHWYQDLILTPADWDALAHPLNRLAAEEVRGLTTRLSDADVPKAVWLTHDAGRLPGLAAALHRGTAERTTVRVLHPEAAAAAAANLLDRWALGELPRTHLDTAIPLPPKADPRLVPKATAPQRTPG